MIEPPSREVLEARLAERCPQCDGPLEQVRYPSGSMLNRDQFDSVRAGDFFCKACKGTNAKSGYEYWWKSDLQRQAPPTNDPTPADALAEHDAKVRREVAAEVWAFIEHVLMDAGVPHIDLLRRTMAAQFGVEFGGKEEGIQVCGNCGVPDMNCDCAKEEAVDDPVGATSEQLADRWAGLERSGVIRSAKEDGDA